MASRSKRSPRKSACKRRSPRKSPSKRRSPRKSPSKRRSPRKSYSKRRKPRYSQCSNVSKVSCLAKNKEGKCRWNYTRNKCEGIGKIVWQQNQANFINKGTITPVYPLSAAKAEKTVKQLRDELEAKFGGRITRSSAAEALADAGIAPTAESVKEVINPGSIPEAPPMFYF